VAFMKIDHVHFYVEDARTWRDWFVNQLGFQAVGANLSSHTCTEVVNSGSIYFVLSSPVKSFSPVASYLSQHPPGVADVALQVEDVAAVMHQAIACGATVLQPVQPARQGDRKWGKIAAWGSLSHTLIEMEEAEETQIGKDATFTCIDHVVLNVTAGDLEKAVAWYENTLGFCAQQTFKIQTDYSALHSQVMVSPNKQVQIPINQPASRNSQIQEFLDANKGPGVQHIALQTPNIVQAISHLRQVGVSFLPVPPSYYSQLAHRQGLPLSRMELQEIAQQQILIDWEETAPQAVLLQIFTQPIFGQPTFFFELIERRLQAQGFGAGNFRALFEAIEREQRHRGSLQ